ncbi:hypothetical protein MASR2M15_13120 [Anaerolineales bacterium]
MAKAKKDQDFDESVPDEAEGKIENEWVSIENLESRVQEIVSEGTARRVRIYRPSGELLVDLPLVLGVLAAGFAIWTSAFWTAIGALAAIVGQVRIEVVRDGAPEQETPTSRTKNKVHVEINEED